jgi:hypothetical protein
LLDAAALSLNPGMFLLGQQQQQLAAVSGGQFMLGGLQQHDVQAGNMFLLGDFQQQQQHPSMFLLPSDAPQHAARFS